MGGGSVRGQGLPSFDIEFRDQVRGLRAWNWALGCAKVRRLEYGNLFKYVVDKTESIWKLKCKLGLYGASSAVCCGRTELK